MGGKGGARAPWNRYWMPTVYQQSHTKHKLNTFAMDNLKEALINIFKKIIFKNK